MVLGEWREWEAETSLKCSKETSQVLPLALIYSTYQEPARQHRRTNRAELQQGLAKARGPSHFEDDSWLQVVTGPVSVFKATRLRVHYAFTWYLVAHADNFRLEHWAQTLRSKYHSLRHSCMSWITKPDRLALLTLVKLWLDNSSSGQGFTEHSIAY